MKFDRDPYRELMNLIPWGPTPRRMAAAKRALKRQQDKLPLFAGEIAASQPTPEERIAYFDKQHLERMKSNRSYKAQLWRETRAWLRSLDRKNREAFLRYWNERWSGSHTPEYCLDLLMHWDLETQVFDWSKLVKKSRSRQGG